MHKCTISRPRKQMHLPRGLTQLLKAGRSEMLTIIITNQPSKLWQSPASQWKSKRTHLYLLGASTSSTTVTRSGRWKAQYQIKLHLIFQIIFKIIFEKQFQNWHLIPFQYLPASPNPSPLPTFAAQVSTDLSIYLHPSSESLFNSLSTQNVDTGWY